MEVVGKLMETPTFYAPPQHHHDSTRPTIGFPLGTALLLLIIFSLTGIFSCCYHWDKLRHLRGSSDPDNQHSPSKPKPTYSEKQQAENWSLPVIMPGDRIARFVALPCSCKPPRQEHITEDDVQKPPHIAVPLC